MYYPEKGIVPRDILFVEPRGYINGRLPDAGTPGFQRGPFYFLSSNNAGFCRRIHQRRATMPTATSATPPMPMNARTLRKTGGSAFGVDGAGAAVVTEGAAFPAACVTLSCDNATSVCSRAGSSDPLSAELREIPMMAK